MIHGKNLTKREFVLQTDCFNFQINKREFLTKNLYHNLDIIKSMLIDLEVTQRWTNIVSP